eukprot:m.106308 g.106308  ORF g.106308 m.106308 type:complete len:392 (-) comp15298_c0_seq2:211-1386(-)
MHSVVGIVDRADQHPYSEQKQHFTPGVLPSGAHNGAMMSSDATMTNFTTIPTMDALPSDLDSHPLSRSSSVSGRQSRGAEEAHSPRARHQFKVRSRPSSPFRDGSPYRRPRAASSSLDKGERAPSYTQRHQFRDRVYSTPEQTTRQPMNPAVEAARNGYPTAQSRSYSAGSSALGSNRSHGQSHNHSSQTTRRHTVRSSVSNVDDELSSLFNVALGTPSRRRGMDIVPLHQRELPASFWSPKKNPALATSSPQGSPQRERVHSRTAQYGQHMAPQHLAQQHSQQSIDFDPYQHGSQSAAQAAQPIPMPTSMGSHQPEDSHTLPTSMASTLPELDGILDDFATDNSGHGEDGLKLFEGLDHLLEAETHLLGLGDTSSLDIFDDLTTGLGTAL